MLIGRPHGGVGFIANNIPGITYVPISTDSERITGIKVITKGHVLFTIFGVYLPYHNGYKNQTDLYCETLCKLQSEIDQCDTSPVMIVGDMNTSLPMHKRLSRRWYRAHPYNNHSFILYDFLCNNNFQVANFRYKQSVDFTYFNDKHRSYIDHVFISDNMSRSVTNCVIMSNVSLNVSDHHPLSTKLSLRVNNPSEDVNIDDEENPAQFPRPNWSDDRFKDAFIEDISKRASALSLNSFDDIKTIDHAQSKVNYICDSLVDSLHKSCAHADSLTRHPKSGSKCKSWWNWDCNILRDKQRFWFHLWKSCGRPREGQVYLCYKHAKKMFRKECKRATNGNLNKWRSSLNSLYTSRNLKKFWNVIRKSSKPNMPQESIDVNKLYDHFKEKFDIDPASQQSPTISNAERTFRAHYENIKEHVYSEYVISESMVQKYIKSLNRGCSAGVDGITPEHLCYSLNSSIPLILSRMLSLCIKFGVVPASFCEGILIPILKKPSLDPTRPSNYRPITVSTTFSKLLEIHILDISNATTFSDYQFGFVNGKSSNMAAALATGIITYCTKRGSPVFTCALDAKGAFDEIPHSIIFYKSMGVVPDQCWRLLVEWYKSISVKIKWTKKLSRPIRVTRGTRQGGLTSPFLFNLFYKNMVDELSTQTGGIKIDRISYNIFSYADDILLASLSAVGLQGLIDTANKYITEHGLSFNPSKTVVVKFGKVTLDPQPSWHLDNILLNEDDTLDYLGVKSSEKDPLRHVDSRIAKCRKAFYSIQGSGLGKYCTPDQIAYVWKTALRPVLTFGLNSINVNESGFSKLEKTQASLLKAVLGLNKSSKSSPLLHALGVQKIKNTTHVSILRLFRSMFHLCTPARSFFIHTIKYNSNCDNICKRAQLICQSRNISFVKFIFDDDYFNRCTREMTKHSPTNKGLSDSVKTCLDMKDTAMCNLLLKSY